jgi:molybdopterin-guanine dinucleotide biosynthesis protein A
LIYHGKPQREHLTDLLKPFCQAVFWSVNADQAGELKQTNQAVVVDAFDFPGPLNGIVSAFQQDPEAAWLVIACDMPLVTTQSITALLAGRDPAKLATVFYDSDGKLPEPLLGIYEQTFGPIMQLAVARGEFSPRQLLRHHDVQLLNVPDISELTNINDPAAKAALGL